MWKDRKVTGEVHLKPAGDGRWFLEVTAEKVLAPSFVAGLKGRRI